MVRQSKKKKKRDINALSFINHVVKALMFTAHIIYILEIHSQDEFMVE